MRGSKLLYPIILMLLVATAGALRLRSAEKSAIAIAPVTRKAIVVTSSSSGKVVPKRMADLKFQTSGKLVWVGVKVGDAVRKGQAIASLDSRDVRKNLEKALRDYSRQRNDFEEGRQVTYKGLSVPDHVPNDTMKRILEKNQWDLEKAVLDVELKSLSVEYATIISPIDGMVTHIDNPVAGVNITPATSSFTVIDRASLVFETNVDESDIASIALGQKATVSLDAFKDSSLTGVVSYISFTSASTSGGATIFPVEISVESTTLLRVGYNGDATIVTKTTDPVLTVPQEAVGEQDNLFFVYRKKAGNYERVDIKTGISNDTDTQILSGINEGDEVVTKGFDSLPKK